ncbi:hypothetical protein [Streptomyces sp. NPDC088254]|uniref:hypothetical protein n=1 Tax=Streptomyces sp. NPDC088254 TaxID=3365847 RepID=UPI00382CADC1
MRRTARVLSVAALGAAVLAGAVPDASAEPAAEIGPAAVPPGGSVTVSVTCDPLGGPAPETVDATSRAFADGTVTLTLVPGGDELTGPAYKGTARIAPATALTVPVDADGAGDPPADAPDGDASPPADASDGAASPPADASDGAASPPAGSAWKVDGVCPAPPGGRGAPWSAGFDITEGGSDAGAPTCPEGKACAPPSAPCEGKACTPPSAPCEDDHPEACGARETCAQSPQDAKDPEAPDSLNSDEPCAGREPCPDGQGEEGDAERGRPCGTPRPAPCPDHTRGADPRDDACAGAAVQHGVRAGAGGAFTDSVPALAAGALLIAGAFGAAVHRLRRRDAAGRL